MRTFGKRHRHKFGMWQMTDPVIQYNHTYVYQVRSCVECGYSQSDMLYNPYQGGI